MAIRPLPLLRRLAADRRAVSGVEFALFLPILLLILAATVDLGYAFTVSRKLTQIMTTVSDLTSNQSEWTETEILHILKATSYIVQPYDAGTLVIALTVVDAPVAGQPKVAWGKTFKGATPTALVAGPAPGTVSEVSVPAAVRNDTSQIIVGRVTYTLSTPFSSLWSPLTGSGDGYRFDRFAFAHPRVSDKIALK
ncbi:TadE/TadG family type IV pilus assembly protein [Aurantimonas sp. Leaf443]|uniref:TadE/TadG family type IV pilus assembly protein n=1 Tax=Aurantimonas sp. Leaf443 TaxID=1736378 RepID=UPI0006FADE16|nr:TadE/TadG family type IV pilus assembly protein [Aurantimonas sp. Leaf443]KQT82517.1 hypothetical protein ASG48_15730 [Aurantimonas sp. Leaf443]